MNNIILQNTLKELHVPDFILRTYNATLARIIASEQNEYSIQDTSESLTRYGFVYERQGFNAFNHFIANREEKYKKVSLNALIQYIFAGDHWYFYQMRASKKLPAMFLLRAYISSSKSLKMSYYHLI